MSLSVPSVGFGQTSLASFYFSTLDSMIAQQSREGVLAELPNFGWGEEDLRELEECRAETHTFEAFLHVLCWQAVKNQSRDVFASLPKATITEYQAILQREKVQLTSMVAIIGQDREYDSPPIRFNGVDFLSAQARAMHRSLYFGPNQPMNQWLLERGWTDADLAALHSAGDGLDTFVDLALEHEDWEVLQSIPQEHAARVKVRLQTEIARISEALYFINVGSSE
jgi:hypothetical protein